MSTFVRRTGLTDRQSRVAGLSAKILSLANLVNIIEDATIIDILARKRPTMRLRTLPSRLATGPCILHSANRETSPGSRPGHVPLPRRLGGGDRLASHCERDGAYGQRQSGQSQQSTRGSIACPRYMTDADPTVHSPSTDKPRHGGCDWSVARATRFEARARLSHRPVAGRGSAIETADGPQMRPHIAEISASTASARSAGTIPSAGLAALAARTCFRWLNLRMSALTATW